MSEFQELESFLREQQRDGLKKTQSEFTIAREKALEKLAESQLPFEGAWALKVIQFAVASNSATSIKVQISRRQTQFWIEGRFFVTTALIERALFEPETTHAPGLEHLISAIRVVGFRDKLGFWLEMGGESNALSWNGAELARKPAHTRRPGLVLVVTNTSVLDEGGFFGLKVHSKANERRATLTNIISTRAYTCPVPLILDGRRVDALEFDPTHGYSPTSQLMMMGFLDQQSVPPLRVPRATVERQFTNLTPVHENLKLLKDEAQDDSLIEDEASAVYLIAAHVNRDSAGSWEEAAEKSVCKWVAHGVVIQSTELGVTEEFCSGCIFLNADDLPTDLSGFSLSRSKEARRRLNNGIKLLLEAFNNLEFDFDRVSKKQDGKRSKIGLGMFVLGVGVGGFSIATGLACATLGVLSLIAIREDTEHFQSKFESSVSITRACLAHSLDAGLEE